LNKKERTKVILLAVVFCWFLSVVFLLATECKNGYAMGTAIIFTVLVGYCGAKNGAV
jgi:heme O synthase-like polyprenyltransferase